MSTVDNPFELNPEQLAVLLKWQDTGDRLQAYIDVMVGETERTRIKKGTIRQRAARFFNQENMKAAMISTPGKRGQSFRDEQQAKQRKARAQAVRVAKEAHSGFINPPPPRPKEEQKREAAMTAEEKAAECQRKWMRSLTISDEPTAISVYGTGLFLAGVAVKEILARQAEIKLRGISPLEKDGTGSPLTPTIISALKTAASMILPFAPAPNADERHEMSKAAVLLGLLPDTIKESPDAFTAPPPNTIEITAEKK